MIRFITLYGRWYKVNKSLTFEKTTIFDFSPSSKLSFVRRKNSCAKRVHVGNFCKNHFFDVVCAYWKSASSVLGLILLTLKFLSSLIAAKIEGKREERKIWDIYANLSLICCKIGQLSHMRYKQIRIRILLSWLFWPGDKFFFFWIGSTYTRLQIAPSIAST